MPKLQNGSKDWLTKEESVIRQAAKCWMVGYAVLEPHPRSWALTKDEQVAGFAHAQSHSTQLLKSQYVQVPLTELQELDHLSRLTHKPAFLVAMFSDFGIYVHTNQIKRPLDVRMVGGKALVHVNSGQFSPLKYEAKW